MSNRAKKNLNSIVTIILTTCLFSLQALTLLEGETGSKSDSVTLISMSSLISIVVVEDMFI